MADEAMTLDPAAMSAMGQGLTLVHFSAQLEPFLTQIHPVHPLLPDNTP